MTINSSIECRHCKYDSEKRVVISQKPLQKVDVFLPNGYKEFLCNNIVKIKRLWKKSEDSGEKIFKWVEEICKNHILVKRVEK